MSYYSFLNSLQHKRQYMLVEPMLSFMQGMNMMFKMGSDTFSNESHTGLNEFLTKTSTLVCEYVIERIYYFQIDFFNENLKKYKSRS